MKYAPFVVPTLCRSEHFIRMIESLKRNSWACYTDIIVGVDFPPSEKYSKGRQEICDYLDHGDFSAFKQLIVFKQTENLGAGKNAAFLGNYVAQHYDRWIYCDDDCEFSPNFLEYMDKCLDAFEDDQNVVAVTGYSYPIDWVASEGATCMKQQFNSATWGLGRWVKKSVAVSEYILSRKMLDDARMVIREGRHEKMISRCFTKYIQAAFNPDNPKELMKKVSDVSLRAYLACQDKYCVSPIVSKARNHGFDGSGLFCQNVTSVDNTKSNSYDYGNQPIDDSEHFDIVLNNPALMEANRKKLDAFDRVPKRQLRVTKIKVFVIRLFGVKFARVINRGIMAPLKLVGLKRGEIS